VNLTKYPKRWIRNSKWLKGLPREVAVLTVIAFFVAIGFGIVIPTIPVFARSFGVSAFAASSVVSVFALMRFASSPISGKLVDRFGERKVLSSGLIIVSISSLFSGLADNFVELLVWRGAGGLGSAMFTVSAFSLILRLAKPDQRGRSVSAFNGGFLIGGLAGPAVGGIVISISLRAPFFVYSVSLMFAAATAIFMLSKASLNDVAKDENEETKEGIFEFIKALKIQPYAAALSVNLATGFISFGLRSAILPIFVVEGLLQKPSLIAVGFLVTSATQAIFLSKAGRTTDDRGRKPAMVIGTSSMLIAVVILIVLPTTIGFLLSMAIGGIAAAFMGAAPAAVVGDVIGNKKSGSLIAGFQMTTDFGSIAGPLVAGYLVDQAGFSWAFASGALVALLALSLSIAMKETKDSAQGVR
jgi:MFS family permease